LLRQPDSAFAQLYRLAGKGRYYNYLQITTEKDFLPLQKDPRWTAIITLVKKNNADNEERLNRQLQEQQSPQQ
jgi:hypothetical protein